MKTKSVSDSEQEVLDVKLIAPERGGGCPQNEGFAGGMGQYYNNSELTSRQQSGNMQE